VEFIELLHHFCTYIKRILVSCKKKTAYWNFPQAQENHFG